MKKEPNCSICEDTGYYGDKGPGGFLHNSEYAFCDCGIFVDKERQDLENRTRRER